MLQVKLKDDHFYAGEAFLEDFKFIKRGDIIGVEGVPVRTDSGELSVLCKRFTVLTPTLSQMPSGILQRIEGRLRRRHMDLMMNPEIRSIFRTRSKVIQHIRDFLIEKDFLEMETPTLINGVGGASATPFTTRHHELKLDLSLRIAPELHLKMLTVGGFDRVFEIGKQFRNEGMDNDHNPEFTSCEFYMAYADYHDLINITEELLGSLASTLHGPGATLLGQIPYKRLDFIPGLESATGRTFPDDPNDFSVVEPFLKDICHRHSISLTSDRGVESSVPKLYDKLFGHFVEPELEEPTFVMHHPRCMSPLAKPHRLNPSLSERFELFVSGMELINAYTELNDPDLQRQAFLDQRQQDEIKDNPLQEDFLIALESGMPPTAGWGLGIDRLVMIATNQKSIREVILFPTMRPADSYLKDK